MIRNTSLPGDMILPIQLTAAGSLGYTPNIHHHRPNLQQGLKQQTLSITDTQQDLTGGINKFRLQGNASFQMQVFIQLYQGMGCSQTLSNYSLLKRGPLLSDFRYQLKFFKYQARLRSWDLWVMGSPKLNKIEQIIIVSHLTYQTVLCSNSINIIRPIKPY